MGCRAIVLVVRPGIGVSKEAGVLLPEKNEAESMVLKNRMKTATATPIHTSPLQDSRQHCMHACMVN